jgi:hypothetical protein
MIDIAWVLRHPWIARVSGTFKELDRTVLLIAEPTLSPILEIDAHKFVYDGGGLGKGGKGTLYVSGEKERDDKFTGKIRKVIVELQNSGAERSVDQTNYSTSQV